MVKFMNAKGITLIRHQKNHVKIHVFILRSLGGVLRSLGGVLRSFVFQLFHQSPKFAASKQLRQDLGIKLPPFTRDMKTGALSSILDHFPQLSLRPTLPTAYTLRQCVLQGGWQRC